jgi:hypothetical protein
MLLVVLACACGHGPKPSEHAPGDEVGSGSGSGADRGSGASGTPAPTAPTHAECEALLEHTLTVGLAEQRAAVSAELVPTADDVAAIRADLGPAMIADCMTYPPEVLACALAATTTRAIAECSLAPAP